MGFDICLIGVPLIIIWAAWKILGGQPFFWLWPVVYLQDYRGEIKRTHMRKGISDPISYWYPLAGMGEVRLLTNGTTRGTSYVRRWAKTKAELKGLKNV